MLQFFVLYGFCTLSVIAKTDDSVNPILTCNQTNEEHRQLCNCEPSCASIGIPEVCDHTCRQDCFCKHGYYRDANGGCVPLRDCPQKDVEKICRLPPAAGTCLRNLPRFYYNRMTEQCEKFYWGGCGGNANHFKTEHECEEVCGGVAECPQGITEHKCAVDPCQPSNCSALSNSDCIADHCGGCKAHFYDVNGQEINEKCSVHGICNMMCTSGHVCVQTPDGAHCVPDQCANNSCTESETCVPAPCITNPCPQYSCEKKEKKN